MLVFDPELKTLRYDIEASTKHLDLISPFPFSLVRKCKKIMYEAAREASKPGDIRKSDSDNIRDIIHAGAQANVDELEIEIEREVKLGLDLGAVQGADITIGSKGKTTYSIKVKYRDQ